MHLFRHTRTHIHHPCHCDTAEPNSWCLYPGVCLYVMSVEGWGCGGCWQANWLVMVRQQQSELKDQGWCQTNIGLVL